MILTYLFRNKMSLSQFAFTLGQIGEEHIGNDID